KSIALRILVKKNLGWFGKHARHENVKKAVENIFALINTDEYNFRFYRSLCGDFEEFWGTEIEYDQRQKIFEEQVNSAALEVIQTEKIQFRIHKRIEIALKELHSYGLDPKATFFISSIVKISPKIGVALYTS